MDPFDRIRKGDVKFFRKSPEDLLLNARNDDEESVLSVAVKHNRLKCCEVIIERCPQLLYHQCSIDGFTALHYAANDKHVRLEIAKLLISEASKTDIKDIESGEGGEIPDKKLFRTVTDEGHTPLHLAVHAKNTALSKMLFEAHHDFELLRVVDQYGQTSLHIAATGSDLEIVESIIREPQGKELLRLPDNDERTPLHMAIEEGTVEMVRLLLEEDASVEYYADSSEPFLIVMERITSSYALGKTTSDLEELYKLLLEKYPSKCTVQTGIRGWTELHHAASAGLLSLVKDIIRLCPDSLKVVDFHGQTFVHIAAEFGYLDVVKYVVETKEIEATVLNKQDETGKTFLHIAAKCGQLDVVKYALETKEIEATVVNKQDETGKTFLHIAAKYGQLDVVKYTLETKEIDATVFNMKDEAGNTPLHIAVLNQNASTARCLLYDPRVLKTIENAKRENAIDLINFPYNEAKAGVYSLGHQRDLKEQSSFDLLVATLISTVSFTAGITVPGGYTSDGTNKGSAILIKDTSFNVFVISNNIALLFSLYTVFLNFSTRRLLKEDDIYYESSLATFRTRLLVKKKDVIYQLNVATICTLIAIYALVVAFITGSYAVLAKSEGLAVTICVNSSFFLILASHAAWRMAMHYWFSKPVG